MQDNLILMVGVPFSGKSAFIEGNFSSWTDVVSLEEITYDVANVRGTIINDKTWVALSKSAQVEFERRLASLCFLPTGVPSGTVVVEGNFLSFRARRNFLKMYGENKQKVAIVMPTPTLEELAQNIILSDKHFSPGGLKDKLSCYQYPSPLEGFDLIVDAEDADLYHKVWG